MEKDKIKKIVQLELCVSAVNQINCCHRLRRARNRRLPFTDAVIICQAPADTPLAYTAVNSIVASRSGQTTSSSRHNLILKKRPGIINNRQPGTNGIGEYCGQYGLPKSQRR